MQVNSIKNCGYCVQQAQEGRSLNTCSEPGDISMWPGDLVSLKGQGLGCDCLGDSPPE